VERDGHRIIEDPFILREKLDNMMDTRVESFRRAVDLYDTNPVSLEEWPRNFEHGRFPDFKIHPIAELRSELLSQINSICAENDKLVSQLFQAGIVSAVKSVDHVIEVGGTKLMTLTELELFGNSTISGAVAVLQTEVVNGGGEWIKTSAKRQLEVATETVRSEVGIKLRKFYQSHEIRLSEWLRKISQKSIQVYQDIKRVIETSMLPCEEGVLAAEHARAVTALISTIDVEHAASRFNDTNPYRDMRMSLDEVVGEEISKLERKNIELWKIHSDEATRCGEEMNEKYVQENCPQGWFCLFKIIPSYHRQIAMDHLMQCFASKRGTVPPQAIQSRVFDSWYEKELAKEAADVKSNMWIAIVSIIVPIVWIGYIRYM
jgi:hypothetical protein